MCQLIIAVYHGFPFFLKGSKGHVAVIDLLNFDGSYRTIAVVQIWRLFGSNRH